MARGREAAHRDFWQEWYALWSAAGAPTEPGRLLLAEWMAEAPGVTVGIGTLRGWVRSGRRRRVPRHKEQLRPVIANLNARASAHRPGHAPLPLEEWDRLRSVAARVRRDAATAPVQGTSQTTDRAADTANLLTEASRSAHSTVEPEILPNIDRLAGLTADLGVDVTGLGTPLAVIGEGGLGKSVLLGQLYAALTEMDDDYFTVLVPCGRVPVSADLSTAAAIDQALGVAAIDDRDAPPLSALLRDAATVKPVRLLLDTLDLIVREHTAQEVAYVLRRLSRTTSVIWTCREQEWLDFLSNEPGLVQALYRLPALEPDQIAAWAQAYTAAAGVDPGRRDAFITSITRPEPRNCARHR